ncbi:hypothetical protein PR202_ga12353 [Eleusine coracana subsp. coracana]|uniref:R13L1/DRL21-like LRR repeat region domain-containing protein n=1 Tax=Eleusine coracana subsp. coracana TaxID=191504 RepID=A0AAV5CBV3_ELECO|nr:hypothetical protein PR202_ga12353 [Eleusine coracana subsp. coracana]
MDLVLVVEQLNVVQEPVALQIGTDFADGRGVAECMRQDGEHCRSMASHGGAAYWGCRLARKQHAGAANRGCSWVADKCRMRLRQGNWWWTGLFGLHGNWHLSGKQGENNLLLTMHDLVHDLARSIMEDEVLDASTQCNVGGRNCRYALLADSSKPLKSFLTYPEKNLKNLVQLDLSGILSSSERSDVTKSILDSISTLSSLEHLDLSRNIHLDNIPDSMCSLRKLHTLDLSDCENLRGLPKNMGCMDNLKFLIMKNCSNLDMTTLPSNNCLIPLPNFVVHAKDGDQSCNLILLEDVNPQELEISHLENVPSIEDAWRIQLREKSSMVKLTLDWTRETKGFLQDMELLRELVPPSSLNEFLLQGYNGVSFPTWLMDIEIYLPNLVSVTLKGMFQCSSLPPLCQLPNLEKLTLEEIPSLRKIDRSFCSYNMKAFNKLKELTISKMENLEEWSTTYSCDEGIADQFMFPNLEYLTISGCGKLRVGPSPPRVKEFWDITDSDGVLQQWSEMPTHAVCPTSSALVNGLSVSSCTVPLHKWKLLHHLPGLTKLIITDCNDLSSSPRITRALGSLELVILGLLSELPCWLEELTSLQILDLRCMDIQGLPEWLGHCLSLKDLRITNCVSILCFPESIQQLISLEQLWVDGCPELVKWCLKEENKIKIGHIAEVRLI